MSAPTTNQSAARRVIVCGSRRWHDRELIAWTLTNLMIERGWNPTIVHGAARGADRIADEEAGKAGFLTEAHPPDWARHGKRAGLIRNEEMANLGADLVIAFWDGKSTGTWHMIEQAKAHGIPWEIHFGKPNDESPARESADRRIQLEAQIEAARRELQRIADGITRPAQAEARAALARLDQRETE